MINFEICQLSHEISMISLKLVANKIKKSIQNKHLIDVNFESFDDILWYFEQWTRFFDSIIRTKCHKALSFVDFDVDWSLAFENVIIKKFKIFKNLLIIDILEKLDEKIDKVDCLISKKVTNRFTNFEKR